MGFNNILIPVDFSENTDIAIKKAIEICDPGSCKFHLMHIKIRTSGFIPFWSGKTTIALCKYEEIEIEKRLNEYKVIIQNTLPKIVVNSSIIWDSNIQQSIIIEAKRIKADLIVIGKSKNHFVLPVLNTVFSSEIAKISRCAVLTVKKGSIHNKIKNVVVPVNETSNYSKMNAVASMCKRTRVNVFLVTFINGDNRPENFSASSVLQAFRWLKTNLNCPVEYAVLHGQNKARAILKFSESHHADILILNSSSETKINWFGGQISDSLPETSKVQVLTV